MTEHATEIEQQCRVPVMYARSPISDPIAEAGLDNRRIPGCALPPFCWYDKHLAQFRRPYGYNGSKGAEYDNATGRWWLISRELLP